MRFTVPLLFLLLLLSCHAPDQEGRGLLRPGDYDKTRVGQSDGRRIVVATNQVLAPAGRQVTFPGRPTDLALSPDGRRLAVMGRRRIRILDTRSGSLLGACPFRASYAGILFTPDGRRLLASDIRGWIGVFAVDAKGGLKARKPIKLPGKGVKNPLPVGLALSADGGRLYAALNLRNALGEIDLREGRLRRQIPVGNAPWGVARVGKRAWVSNFGGRLPGREDRQAAAGRGGPVRVDGRGIACEGTLSVVDLEAGRQLRQIQVGLHPSGVIATADGKQVLVANANSDTVSVVDTGRMEVIETLSTRPDPKLLFGSSPTALAFSPDEKTLYVANSANNAIAVVQYTPGKCALQGFIPTGWYPAGLQADAGGLYVSNVKGVGSRNRDWRGRRKVKGKVVYGFNSHDYQGSVSLIPLPGKDRLARHTATVRDCNRRTTAVNALLPPRPQAEPRPVPRRHGEPSVFRHVVYIIKENRTYDQVFGDLEQGEGDPSLCIFGREVTPNHHRLVEEFVLLDNFYCCGTLSADGHQWTSQAFVTSYIEKAYAGWPRSYPYDGGDALAYASSGFLWDKALAQGLRLRVYGEFVKATVRWRDPARKGRPRFLDCYRDFLEGTNRIEVRARAAVATLAPHICPTAIGFPSIVPDIHRAAQFLEELKGYEAAGSLPNLMIVLLPNDHTAGTREHYPTPEAAVADNDLALGRIVEGLSRSRFWKETCIFVVQDDPQNGFDHIDGRRTVAMVISPWTRRGVVDSTNYNQLSMVRTIELILGLPPMNQFDSTATAMASCFAAKPDYRPYEALPNRIPLDRMNRKVSQMEDPRARRWALASLSLPLDDIDRAHEDTLNRILWFAARGRDDTYPAWAVLRGEGEEDR